MSELEQVLGELFHALQPISEGLGDVATTGTHDDPTNVGCPSLRMKLKLDGERLGFNAGDHCQ